MAPVDDLEQVCICMLIPQEHRRRIDLVGDGLVNLSKRQEHVEEELRGIKVGGLEVERKSLEVRRSSLFPVSLAPRPS